MPKPQTGSGLFSFAAQSQVLGFEVDHGRALLRDSELWAVARISTGRHHFQLRMMAGGTCLLFQFLMSMACPRDLIQIRFPKPL